MASDWVSEISGDVSSRGEDTERVRQLEAQRTTAMWECEFEAEGSFSRDERELGDGELNIDERTNWGTDVLLVRTLADHWSAGVIAGAGASTRLNQDFGAAVAAAIEYSFYPYEDAPRRSLMARYDLKVQHYNWEEGTIFFETKETRPPHRIRFQLFQRQPWGETIVGVDGNQFLHDLGLWSISFFGNLEFRIFCELNLDLGGNLAWIENQIFISRVGFADAEALLGHFERPTDSTYSLRMGLSYEFGSIFNNVVNNRFDGGGGGGGRDFD